eukprot:TRINITY_DN11041_c0_g1_i1.p1 TRINITY_DN11041_c0_g1~~TRINITY_DN11041_c0_g1_i1.p1  ORF type:complete len:225 (+),score=50.03 TRINITY_DN11041_c0_g1_i1:181-855(+)
MGILDLQTELKIILVGDSGVGKSSMLMRYVDAQYRVSDDDLTCTIGVDSKIRSTTHQGSEVKMRIWDTAGQEKFRTLTRSLYHKSVGVILAYDVTDLWTFQNVSRWMKEIKTYAPGNVSIVLVGNKSDDPAASTRQVTSEQGKAIADQYGVSFIETSAYKGTNVESAFEILLDRIHEKNLAATVERADIVLQQVNRMPKRTCSATFIKRFISKIRGDQKERPSP